MQLIRRIVRLVVVTIKTLNTIPINVDLECRTLETELVAMQKRMPTAAGQSRWKDERTRRLEGWLMDWSGRLVVRIRLLDQGGMVGVGVLPTALTMNNKVARLMREQGEVDAELLRLGYPVSGGSK